MPNDDIRLYLAFTYTTEAVPPGLNHTLLRAVRGPYEHVELALSDGRHETWRVLVRQPEVLSTDVPIPVIPWYMELWRRIQGQPQKLLPRRSRRIERTDRHYQDKLEHTWVFYRVICTEDQLWRINAAINEHADDYFSLREMYASGLPWLPRWMLEWLVPEHPPTEREGQPTYCTKLCVQALKAGGFLPNQPPELTTASDLLILAETCMPTQKTDRPILGPRKADSTGPRSFDSQMAAVWV